MGLLLDSFNEKLEYGHYVTVPHTRPVAVESGFSTKMAEEPKLRIDVPFSIWDTIANVALQAMKAKKHFSNDRSPRWNNARAINVEGDVSEASSIYLLYAIDSVLSKYLPDQFRFLAQHTVSVANYTVRADRIWGLDAVGSLNSMAYFAILDFKRPSLIDPLEFGAPYTWSTFCELDPSVYRTSQFVGNAQILMKQAVGYSEKYGTKFVAFFDWHTLVLVVLADAEMSQGGSYCLITVVTDRSKMRRALLGFLIRAYNACVAPIVDYTDIVGPSNTKTRAPHKGSSGSSGERSRRGR